MKLPNEVNILGIIYTIEYLDKPSDVDIFKRKSLWGQIDYWTRTIRVYKKDNPDGDIWNTIIHEVLHGIIHHLNLKTFDAEENHDDLDVLALAIYDVFTRNNWMKE